MALRRVPLEVACCQIVSNRFRQLAPAEFSESLEARRDSRNLLQRNMLYRVQSSILRCPRTHSVRELDLVSTNLVGC